MTLTKILPHFVRSQGLCSGGRVGAEEPRWFLESVVIML